MSALPMSLIKGQSNAKSELEKVRQKQKDNKAHIQSVREKVRISIIYFCLLHICLEAIILMLSLG